MGSNCLSVILQHAQHRPLLSHTLYFHERAVGIGKQQIRNPQIIRLGELGLAVAAVNFVIQVGST